MRIAARLLATGSRLTARFLALLALLAATCAPAQELDFTNDIRPLLDTYCFSCHGPQKQKGGLDLSKQVLPGTCTTADHRWDGILRELADQVMPPPEKPQPTAIERERLTAWIERALEGPPGDPGWSTIRRLTRLEYNRTINDLLGVAGDPAQVLPADNAGGAGGFDNLADTLYVSSLFLERLFEVSQSLVEQASPQRLGIVAPEKDKKDKNGEVTAQTRRKAVEASLAGFLPRAWRRPVTASEIAALVKLYEHAVKRPNAVYDDAVRLVYAAALSSPNFLFRHEDARRQLVCRGGIECLGFGCWALTLRTGEPARHFHAVAGTWEALAAGFIVEAVNDQAVAQHRAQGLQGRRQRARWSQWSCILRPE